MIKVKLYFEYLSGGTPRLGKWIKTNYFNSEQKLIEYVEQYNMIQPHIGTSTKIVDFKIL
jgi:hypothetical protein